MTADHDPHGSALTENQWWGCEHPERPYKPGETCYWGQCRACWLHAKTAEMNGFADMVRPDSRGSHRTLADFVALFTPLHAPARA